MKNKIISLALFFSIIIPQLHAQKDYQGVQEDSIPLDPHVRYGKLENGFTYYLHPNSIPDNQIEINLNIKAGGSFYEDADQIHYAHLLEHMGYKSTKNFPDAPRYFSNSGGYMHASTGRLFVNYNLRLPSKNSKLLNDGLKWVKDLTKNISLEQSSIDVERGAVLGEARVSDLYSWWKNSVLDKTAFQNTNYRDIFSTQREVGHSLIRNFDREAFIRFYRDWYRPDLEAVTVVGDFNVDSVEVQVKEVFSDLANPREPRSAQERRPGKLKLSGENQFISVVDTIVPGLRMVFMSKSVDEGVLEVKNRDDYRKLLLQEIYKGTIEKRSEIFNTYDPPISDFRIDDLELLLESVRFTINFTSNDLNYARERFINALLLWKQLHTGITKPELVAVKNQILNWYTSPSQSNIDLSLKYRNHFVYNIAAPGEEREFTIVEELLNSIDLNELQSYAQEVGDLSKNKDFLFFHGPDDNVPNLAAVESWVKEAVEINVPAIEPPKAPITSLKGTLNLAKDPDMEGIEFTENEIGVTTIKLPNEITLILKPSKPNSQRFSNSVNILAYLAPGVPYKNKKDRYIAATIAPDAIRYAGAGSYTKFELSEFMMSKGIGIQIKADAFSQFIRGSSKIDDVEEFFSLVNLYATKPRKDKIAFNEWKSSKLKEMNGIGSRHSSGFYDDSIKLKEYPSLPEYTYADIEELKIDEIYNAYSERFTNFSGYTFIITGDFDTKELSPHLIRYISALPMEGKKIPIADSKPVFSLNKKNEKIVVPNVDQVFVNLSFPFIAKKDLKSELILKLLGKALNERIYSKLRLGSYVPRAHGHWIDKENGIYSFKILFDSELGSEKKLIELAKEEFRNLQKNGVEQEWLQNAINNEKLAYANNIDYFAYSSFWEGYLHGKLEGEEDLTTEVLKYQTVLQHFINLDEVNEAAKKYMTEENLQQILVVPEGYKLGI